MDSGKRVNAVAVAADVAATAIVAVAADAAVAPAPGSAEVLESNKNNCGPNVVYFVLGPRIFCQMSSNMSNQKDAKTGQGPRTWNPEVKE